MSFYSYSIGLFVVVSYLCTPLGASEWQVRARNYRWHQIKSEMEWPIQTHMTVSNVGLFTCLSQGQCLTVRAGHRTVYSCVLSAHNSFPLCVFILLIFDSDAQDTAEIVMFSLSCAIRGVGILNRGKTL